MKSKHEKVKKPFYKKWWFWLIVVIVIVGAVGGGDTEDSNVATESNKVITEEKSEKVNETSAAEEKDTSEIQSKDIEENTEQDEDVPTEYKSALNKAQSYVDLMNMSKAGLYDQLTSEYGEQFSKDAAKYAVDNVDADWKENALKKAQ